VNAATKDPRVHQVREVPIAIWSSDFDPQQVWVSTDGRWQFALGGGQFGMWQVYEGSRELLKATDTLDEAIVWALGPGGLQ
jgi:hypothetical protein